MKLFQRFSSISFASKVSQSDIYYIIGRYDTQVKNIISNSYKFPNKKCEIINPAFFILYMELSPVFGLQ